LTPLRGSDGKKVVSAPVEVSAGAVFFCSFGPAEEGG
jgi:hypothetical protein